VQFKDYFSAHASQYRTFRPGYPRVLFEYLSSIAAGHDRAWDCATGSGQAARSLKPFFRHVTATDASPEQIAAAEPTEGIEYAVAPAEQTQIPDRSIDLVAVAQALHWFDLVRFFAEVERVGKPGCIVACWSYGLLQINRDIDRLLRRLNERVLKDYWPLERKLVDEGYSTADFPFEELKPPTFHMTQRWNFDQVLGYLGTWSSVQKFAQQRGSSPLPLLGEKLLAAWGDPAVVRQIVWPLYLRIGRVRPLPPSA
jgi:SAM-dependent methyltransferase